MRTLACVVLIACWGVLICDDVEGANRQKPPQARQKAPQASSKRVGKKKRSQNTIEQMMQALLLHWKKAQKKEKQALAEVKKARLTAKKAKRAYQQAKELTKEAESKALRAGLAVKKAWKAVKEARAFKDLNESELRWKIDGWEIKEHAVLAQQMHREWKKFVGDASISLQKSQALLLHIRKESNIFSMLGLAHRVGMIRDPVFKRRVGLLLRQMKGYHLPPKALVLRRQIVALERKLLKVQRSYVFVFDGKKVTREQLMGFVLRHPQLQKRESAWRDYASMGAEVLKHGFMKLIRLRNQYAKLFGYPTFFHYRHHQLGLKPDQVWLLYEALRLSTEKETARLMANSKKHHRTSRLMPWELFSLLDEGWKQQVRVSPQLDTKAWGPWTLGVFRGMGFRFGTSWRHQHTVRSHKRASSWPCFVVEAPYDVRVAVNLREKTLASVETLFQQMGCYLHATHIQQATRTFRFLPDEEFLRLGLQRLFSGMVDTPSFYKRYLKLKPGQWQKLLQRKRKRAGHRLVRLRWMLLWNYFERDLYIHAHMPDPTLLFWRRFSQLFGPAPKEPPPFWGVRSFLIQAPMHYQHELLAQMFAAQLREALQRKTGRADVLGNPAVAGFLKQHFFRHGRRYPWQQLVKLASGKALSHKAYLRFLRKP